MERIRLIGEIVRVAYPAFLEGVNLIGIAAAIGGPLSVIIVAAITLAGKKGETETARTASHSEAVSRTWDDVTGLTLELRKFIAEEVENQVRPIREELIRERKSRREAFAAFRAYVTDVFMWNIRGRVGPMPQISTEWQHRLEVGYLTAYDDLDDTVRVSDLDTTEGG